MKKNTRQETITIEEIGKDRRTIVFYLGDSLLRLRIDELLEPMGKYKEYKILEAQIRENTTRMGKNLSFLIEKI